ncbi:hypothetical protein ACB098_12G117400 [Castanea mollissima]
MEASSLRFSRLTLILWVSRLSSSSYWFVL